MICRGVTAKAGVYGFLLCPVEEDLVLTINIGVIGAVLIEESQDGMEFAKAVCEAFPEHLNEQSDFRKGLRKVFRRYRRKNPVSAEIAHGFYLRILHQYTRNKLKGVQHEETSRGLWD